MLPVTAKYAKGLIYPNSEDRDMTEEPIMLKNMILRTYSCVRRGVFHGGP